MIQRPIMCSHQYHEDQPLEFCCKDCKDLVCRKCSVVSHNRHSMTNTQKAIQEQKMQMKEVVDKVKAKPFVYENEIKEQTELKSKNIADIMNEGREMSETARTDSRSARTRNLVPRVLFPKPGKSALGTRLENTIIFVTFMKRNKKTLNVTGKIGADYRPTKALPLERGQGIFARSISLKFYKQTPSSSDTVRNC